MVKKIFLAIAVSLLFAGATMTAAPTEAYACKSGCFKKAKAKYGHDWKARHAYAKACRKAYRAAKKGAK
jgi:hypothetical protein